MGQQLANQVMIITGAGSAMGQKTMRYFARAGAKIVAADTATSSLAATVQTLTDEGYPAIAVPTDMTQPTAVQTLLTSAQRHFGRVDGLILHAGQSNQRMAPEIVGDRLWDQVTHQTRASLLEPLKQTSQLFNHQHHGAIVLIATVGPLSDAQHEIAYTAAKRATVTLARQTSRQLSSHVRLNAITPGNIQADIVEPLRVRRAQLTGGLRVITKPNTEIAQKAAFLASNQAHDVNDLVVSVDKGWFV